MDPVTVEADKPEQTLKQPMLPQASTVQPQPATQDDDDEMYAVNCCCGLRLGMAHNELPLFIKKVLFVFVLTFALVPLIGLKSRIPKLAYTLFLVGLHVFILFVYFYRVKLRKLDADWKSVLARLMGLALTIAMLLVAAENEQDTKLLPELLLMLAICSIHTVVLLLLMVRVRYTKSESQVRLINESADSQDFQSPA